MRAEMGRFIRLALLLAGILFSSCLVAQEKEYDSCPATKVCLPDFPDKDGWYGGDGAYSIRLDEKRILWLFGDTFVSDQEGRKDRRNMKVVLGTTLAISTCTPKAEFQIHYWLKKKDGEFISFFGENEWLWPQDPFIVDHTLYIPLLAVKASPKLQGNFNFEINGHKIARIKNYARTDPLQWNIDYLDLTPHIPQSIKAFATTSLIHRGYIYFYPFYSATKDGLAILGNILARISLKHIDDPGQAIEYLSRDGNWEKNLNHRLVKVVLDAAVSEMSVRYHPDKKKWVAVYMSIRNNGGQMLFKTAEALEGPWSESKVLLDSIPEVNRSSPLYDKNNFCYAGKEHVEFACGRKLLVTYVCNSHEDIKNDESFIRRNLFIYRPVVVVRSY